MAFSASLPGFCLLWGDLFDNVGAGPDMFDGVGESALQMLYLGCITCVAAWMQMWSFNQFSENVVFRIKLDYFKQCLMKDADYFDKNNPLELTAKINKETAAMQNGMGNKVGAVLLASFSLIFGFGFAFWWGWLYTLILLASFPALAIAGVAMSVAMESGTGDSMRAYSQSSGYAE